MKNLGEHIQQADWKTEKHVPVIECSEKVKVEEIFEVKVGLGKEVVHPNTTEHHIRWISLYFYPEGDTFPCEIGHFEFNAHGESAKGPNEGPAYTHHQVGVHMKVTKSGILHALAFCNIHGLWENSKEIQVG